MVEVLKMKMCKYCGGVVKGDGCGRFGVYCKKSCADAAEGFDNKLATERRDRDNGSVSFDAFMAKGGDLSDGGEAMGALYDRLDGTEPKYNPKMDVAEVMRKAADIHPLLPSALVFIGQGMTQAQAAKKVGMKQQNLSEYVKQLRVTH